MTNMTDELTIKLNDILERDPRTADSQIEALNNNGVVTLIGIAFSHEARQAADEIAQGTLGVLSVTNDIEVRDSADVASDDIDPDTVHGSRIIVPLPVRPLGPNQ